MTPETEAFTLLSSRGARSAPWRSSRFDRPFDRLRVVSEVEPLKVPVRIQVSKSCPTPRLPSTGPNKSGRLAGGLGFQVPLITAGELSCTQNRESTW